MGIGFEEEEEGVLGSTSSSLPLTGVDSKARRLCRSSSLSVTSGSLKREESKTWNSKLEAGGGNWLV